MFLIVNVYEKYSKLQTNLVYHIYIISKHNIAYTVQKFP